MIDNKKSFLEKALIDNQLDLSKVVQEQMLTFLNLLDQWNRVYSLTAIRDPREMVMLHIIDSLSINRFLHGTRIIDVGTGPGLPGIPLALMNPDKEFTLLDSNSKKTRFITQVLLELKIKNIEVVTARAEEFHPEKGFDSIITRAFSSLKDMLEITGHLGRPEAQFLAMKGVYPEAEIQEIPEGYRVMNVLALRVNGLDAERHLVCMTKSNGA